MFSIVYCAYYTRPQGKSSKVRNMPLKACSKWLIAKLVTLKMLGLLNPVCRLQSLIGKYTRRRSKICFHFEANFAGKLRTNYEHTLFEVRDYFVQSLGLLRSKFGITRLKFGTTSFEVWGHFIRSAATSYEMRTYVPVNFVQSLGQLRTNFVQTSFQLWTNFKPTLCEACEVRTTHGNIISVTTVPSKWPSVCVCSSPAVGRTTHYWVSN